MWNVYVLNKKRRLTLQQSVPIPCFLVPPPLLEHLSLHKRQYWSGRAPCKLGLALEKYQLTHFDLIHSCLNYDNSVKKEPSRRNVGQLQEICVFIRSLSLVYHCMIPLWPVKAPDLPISKMGIESAQVSATFIQHAWAERQAESLVQDRPFHKC